MQLILDLWGKSIDSEELLRIAIILSYNETKLGRIIEVLRIAVRHELSQNELESFEQAIKYSPIADELLKNSKYLEIKMNISLN